MKDGVRIFSGENLITLVGGDAVQLSQLTHTYTYTGKNALLPTFSGGLVPICYTG